MKKMIIADDEIIIRTGLKKALDWAGLGIELVGEAEDGMEALELVKQTMPDLMLVDINMPLLNGIELIEAVMDYNNDCKIIIITGYDEFEYAREAIRLNVSDYILKPVSKRKLLTVVEGVLASMEKSSVKQEYTSWAQRQIESSKQYLLRDFFGGWMSGRVLKDELQLQLKLFGFPLDQSLSVISVSPIGNLDSSFKVNHLEHELLIFCIINIMLELFQERKNCVVLADEYDNVLCFYGSDDEKALGLLEDEIRGTINKYLKCDVHVKTKFMGSLMKEMIIFYKDIIKSVEEAKLLTPVVQCAKTYIDNNFSDKDLTLELLASKLDISAQYLSKLIKKELGMTYKEYLTGLRIEKAILYMKAPSVRMYEVADRVGYKSQHYFSAAFKKVKGISPNEYKAKST